MVDLVATRHDWLLERVASQQRVGTNSAAEELGVSVDTIRRDLRHLHDSGLIRRVHGGAVRLSPLSPSFTGRASDPSAERVRLADAIISRLRPGQVIGLDAGTTTTEIASRLPRSLHITIVTNNPAAAVGLADHPYASVILVGGDVDLRWMATTGATAVDAIRDHQLDLSIVGVCSYDPDAGATTRSHLEVATKRALIEAAAETLVPVESGKLGTTAPFRITDATDLEVLAVAEAEPSVLERCRSAGITVTLA
jgi:DeoR/GlpR family transcriptional regulator of sugar metabolism